MLASRCRRLPGQRQRRLPDLVALVRPGIDDSDSDGDFGSEEFDILAFCRPHQLEPATCAH
jgi:hypothetical protein